MSSYNMPPGVTVNMIPGYNDPDYIVPDVRCPFCGAFVANTAYGHNSKNFIKQEIHRRTFRCHGGEHAICDNYAFCRGPHDFEEYDGMSLWYKCSRCGCDVEHKDY